MQLFLVVDVDTFAFMGKTSIMVNVLENTDTIVLHAAENIKFDLDSVTVMLYPNSGGALDITAVSREYDYETVSIVLDKPLQKGKHYKITFPEFSSELLSGLYGFYRSSYTAKDGTTKSASQF